MVIHSVGDVVQDFGDSQEVTKPTSFDELETTKAPPYEASGVVVLNIASSPTVSSGGFLPLTTSKDGIRVQQNDSVVQIKFPEDRTTVSVKYTFEDETNNEIENTGNQKNNEFDIIDGDSVSLYDVVTDASYRSSTLRPPLFDSLPMFDKDIFSLTFYDQDGDIEPAGENSLTTNPAFGTIKPVTITNKENVTNYISSTSTPSTRESSILTSLKTELPEITVRTTQARTTPARTMETTKSPPTATTISGVGINYGKSTKSNIGPEEDTKHCPGFFR